MRKPKVNPSVQHAETIKSFWREMGERRHESKHEWYETISVLQKYGEIVIEWRNKYPLQDMRQVFDSRKHNRRYLKFLPNDKCFACGGIPQARHHIIWLKNGGRNLKRNVCFLCHDCHAEVHPWLKSK